MNADTILGIDPGTRFVGVAVVQRGMLVHYQVRSFQGPWSHRKLKVIVANLEKIRKYYGIRHIVVKVPDVFPVTKGFNQLIGSFNVGWGGAGIKLQYHSFSEIKARYCPDDQPTTASLITVMVRRHPELTTEYLKEQKNEEPYYYKIFTAVASAHMPSPKYKI